MMICEVRDDLGHIYAYFSDVVTLEDCVGLFNQVGEKIREGSDYKEIVVFDVDTKLHRMDLDTIKTAQRHMAETYKQKGLKRPRCAFVSLDPLAEPVLNYWRALCENDEAVDANYQVFNTLDEACAWCGISRDDTLAFVDRARTGKRTGQP